VTLNPRAEGEMGYPSFGKSLEEMTDEVRKVNVEHGWRDGTNTFGDYIALLHSECSEALEAYRDWRLEDASQRVCEGKKRHGPEGGQAHLCKPEGIGSEFADILIRLLDTCDVYGIDLAREYERKISYNRTRPYQHGGRTLNGGG
jgi:NTP pyrophosphatase (non-canonical NTP hydrolase)